MINNMKLYDYHTYGDKDGYGQPVLSPQPMGKIKLNINTISQDLSTNSLYNSASYIGLTLDKNVSDKYVIICDDNQRLKVKYVNPKGRFKQIFMELI